MNQQDPYLERLLEESDRLIETHFSLYKGRIGGKEKGGCVRSKLMAFFVGGLALVLVTIFLPASKCLDLAKSPGVRGQREVPVSIPRDRRGNALRDGETRFQRADTSGVDAEKKSELRHQGYREVASLILASRIDFQHLIDRNELSDRLSRFLTFWRDEMWRSESTEFTVIAYADRANDTIEHCRHSQKMAVRRAEVVSDWLQRFAGDGYEIHAKSQTCHPPPDVVNPSDRIARRIVLLEGHVRMKCDCAETFSVS